MTTLKAGSSCDVNLTAIMEAERIEAVKYWVSGLYSVTLFDGRIGIGRSVGDALAKAKLPDADNVRRAA